MGVCGENSMTNRLSYGMFPNTHLSVCPKRRVMEKWKMQNKDSLGEKTPGK
jgi:hypothetical protein